MNLGNQKFILAILQFCISCHGVKEINKATSPIIPIAGCAGGFGLRAKEAKVLVNDSLALQVILELSAAAKADVNITDSLLKSGAQGNVSGHLNTSFKKYFELDQSIADNVWNSSNAFTQLYCMLDKISQNEKVPQAIRDSATNRMISLITSQTEYMRNLEKKNQN